MQLGLVRITMGTIEAGLAAMAGLRLPEPERTEPPVSRRLNAMESGVHDSALA